MSSPVITIVGSLNADLVTRTPRFPNPGETITAHAFSTGCGGKGANQAVAAARLSGTPGKQVGDGFEPPAAEVRMIGAVGQDQFGTMMLDQLEEDQIDASGVLRVKDSTTGTASITVDDSGENSILVVRGANGRLPHDRSLLKGDETIVLFQLEVDIEVVEKNLKAAKQNGAITILNPAPAARLSDSILSNVDILVFNEHEMAICGPDPAELGEDKTQNGAEWFMARGVKYIALTLGSKGSKTWSSNGETFESGAGAVEKVVDTTAAGDTWVGAFAVVIALGAANRKEAGQAQSINMTTIKDAVRFAHVAAGKTVERSGAISSIPQGKEVQAAYEPILRLLQKS
ncbi:Ribokinase-like protein [Eremomyces bilateralis CBS 781.70]|uniref:Ribokinase n=1 Tax=Eremomyces bilateralis CBS 781.70 TaxID=1392243 RepID=A0A6G1G307_9PEZI|nr:Ribokinase-like protein [Eremomyces bilateralis CBS 781.70]KAF1812372.1 Ribokinase-like protein [Eremomyces bilateralis CBS 781.70]